MLRTFVCALVALLILAGGLLADEGTVVNVNDKGVITVKVGDKELKTGDVVKLFTADGKEAKAGDFKKDQKVDVTIKDGKVTEVKAKK